MKLRNASFRWGAFLALGVLSGVANAQYRVMVGESTNGSNPPANWRGVLRFDVSTPGGAAVAGTGIPAASVSDPGGLTFSASGELFVGNRHGNGSPSSVSRFLYDSGSNSYLSNGTITGNSLFGTHGVAFSTTGELFAANVNGPISRFTFSGGTAVANGTMGSGAYRDVAFSADGKWAYATQGVSANLLKYDLATGNLVNTFAIAGAAGLHWMNWRNGELYVSAYNSGTVHAIDFDANGDVTSSSIAASAATAIGVAFSPDGSEMFVTGHTSGVISRFLYSSGSWVANGSIVTNEDMGDIAIIGTQAVPEPATLVALGAGALALARRRRPR